MQRLSFPSSPLRRPVPGRLFEWVKWASYFELALFSILLVVWILPGYESATAVFGAAHGFGFVALCIVMWIAILRREAPYPLLAATLTPAGPFGSVIGIALIERRGWGIAPRGPDSEPMKKGIDRSAPRGR